MLLGIDFGTTRTVVACSERGNYPVVAFESPDGDLSDHFPTLAAFREGQRVYGLEALAAAADPSWTLIRSFKRLLADPSVGPQHQVQMGDDYVSLFELIVEFLQALSDALGTSSTLGAFTGPLRAMVATPAGASSTWRFLTLEAFRAAGFEVAGVLDEPSAAAVEFAHRYARTITSRRERVLVYDLGGGTFDVSLVDLGAHRHEVLANRGLGRLGGEDFDLLLARSAMRAAGLSGEPGARLLEHARTIKESVNPNTRRVHIELGNHLPPDAQREAGLASDHLVTLPTGPFYEALLPLIERTLDAVAEVVARDDDGQFTDDALSGVYVVGGASSLPIVSRRLREVFGRRVRRSTQPSASTAIGLAIALDREDELVLAGRFARHFGVFRELRCGEKIVFDQIFDDDTPRVEAERVRRYRPTHDIGHFRFVECSNLDNDGAPGGDITPHEAIHVPFAPSLRQATNLSEQPIRRTGPGPLIEERYALDEAGGVTLTVSDLEDGWSHSWRIGATSLTLT